MKKCANFNSSQKLKELQCIFIHIFNTVEFKLFGKDVLTDIHKDEYEEDLLNNTSSENDSSFSSED